MNTDIKYPVVVGSNCCAGNFYHNYLNTPFYSPFIWCVVPYDSIFNIMTHWTTIDWNDIKITPNPTRDLTFTLHINNIAALHYVHYFWSAKYTKPYAKGASIFYKNIHEYIINKYEERVNRMLTNGSIDNPIFIIHEEQYSNETNGDMIPKIMAYESPYKRIVITHTIDLSNRLSTKNCLYIFDSNKMLPEPMILKYGDTISEFCNINKSNYNLNNNITLPAQ